MQRTVHEVKGRPWKERSHARRKAEEAEFRRKAPMKDGAKLVQYESEASDEQCVKRKREIVTPSLPSLTVHSIRGLFSCSSTKHLFASKSYTMYICLTRPPPYVQHAMSMPCTCTYVVVIKMVSMVSAWSGYILYSTGKGSSMLCSTM